MSVKQALQAFSKINCKTYFLMAISILELTAYLPSSLKLSRRYPAPVSFVNVRQPTDASSG
jgi:hypothetical protein